MVVAGVPAAQKSAALAAHFWADEPRAGGQPNCSAGKPIRVSILDRVGNRFLMIVGHGQPVRSWRASARTQILLCALAGTAVAAVALALLPWQAAILVGWDATAVGWVAWTALAALPLDAPSTRRAASREDD